MRNPFSNIFNSNDSAKPRIGAISINKLVRSTLKEVKAMKAAGCSYSEVKAFSAFIFDCHNLGVHGAYDETIEDKSDDQSDSERRVKHIEAHYSAYIESEKKGISERLFRLIDKLAASVQRMKSQTKEHNSFTKNR